MSLLAVLVTGVMSGILMGPSGRLAVGLRRVIQRVDQHSIALVREAIDQGVLEAEDPAAVVTIFRLAFQGWLLNHQHGENQLSQAQLTLAIKRLILELINDD